MRGKRVLIAGATGNVAPAFIRAFLDAGAEVILTGREADRLAERAREFGLRGIPADLARAGAAEALIAQTGPLDGVVNLSGAFASAPVRETPPEVYDRMIAANLSGLFHLARAALPSLAERRGFLVGVSAAAGWRGGQAGLGAYAAAKAGVLALLRSIGAEEPAVRVLALVPMGAIDTPANRAAMPGADPSKWIKPEALAAATIGALSLAGGKHLELPVYPAT